MITVFTYADCNGFEFETYDAAMKFIKDEGDLNVRDKEISYHGVTGEPVAGWIDCFRCDEFHSF